MALPATWTAICRSRDLPGAVFEHLAPVLATSPANRTRLRQICRLVKAARIDRNHDAPAYYTLELDFGIDQLACSRPDRPDPRLPGSFRRILALHGRLHLLGAQVNLFHETFIEDEGWLDENNLAGLGVYCPLRVAADIYIYHPRVRGPAGEPALYFLDHEEADRPRRVPGDLPSLFLRHVASRLMPRAKPRR